MTNRHILADRAVDRRDARLRYIEYAPSEALSDFVACYWTVEIDRLPKAGLKHRILPDGCTDIIFAMDNSPRGNVVGYMTGNGLGCLTKPDRSVCVRFKPGATRSLYGVDAAELTDGFVGLSDLWSGSDALVDQMASSPSIEDRIDILERALLDRTRRGRPVDPRIVGSLRDIVQSKGQLRVEEVASAAGMSTRQLSRRFIESVGVSTKAFSRGVRFISLIRKMPDRTGWASLAFDHGYSDQAHFDREFKRFSGLTPTACLESFRRDAACPILSIPRSDYLV